MKLHFAFFLPLTLCTHPTRFGFHRLPADQSFPWSGLPLHVQGHFLPVGATVSALLGVCVGLCICITVLVVALDGYFLGGFEIGLFECEFKVFGREEGLAFAF
jgi:hypothetical protein